MRSPSKIYAATVDNKLDASYLKRYMDGEEYPEFIRKDHVMDLVKLAYGKVSMNPFDCSEAFEELIESIESL